MFFHLNGGFLNNRSLLVPAVVVTIVFCILSFFNFSTLANNPPIPEKDILTTEEGTPVKVTLAATDKDVDPMKPYLHDVNFEILSGPFNGELTGDIQKTKFYESPHRVFVELEYTPDPDFRGIDSITYKVEDEEGEENIAQIKIDVIARTIPQSNLFGYWESSAFFEDDDDYFSDFDSDLAVIYRYGDFETGASLGWSMDEWHSLSINTVFPLGALEIESEVDFDPDDEEPFDDWKTEVFLFYSQIDFEYTFNLDEDSEDIYHELDARWNMDNGTISSKTEFTGADPKFEESSLEAKWNLTDSNLWLNTNLSFTDDGFDQFSLNVGRVPLFLGFYFGFETTFTSSSKDVMPSIFYRSSFFDCVRLDFSLVTNDEGNRVEGLEMKGLRFRNTFPNGIDFRTAIYLETPADNGLSKLSTELTLSGPIYAGSESPGRWRLTNDLGFENNQELFGWEESKLKVIAPLSEYVDFENEITFSSESPRWAILIGAAVFW